METNTDTTRNTIEQLLNSLEGEKLMVEVDNLLRQIVILKSAKDELQQSLDTSRKINRERKEIVTKFITENFESGASSDDLKSLAEELDIELTKNVTVEFTVSYTAEITVPIDYDTDQISESDFDVEVRFNGDNDTELDNDSYEIDDFEVTTN